MTALDAVMMRKRKILSEQVRNGNFLLPLVMLRHQAVEQTYAPA